MLLFHAVEITRQNQLINCIRWRRGIFIGNNLCCTDKCPCDDGQTKPQCECCSFIWFLFFEIKYCCGATRNRNEIGSTDGEWRLGEGGFFLFRLHLRRFSSTLPVMNGRCKSGKFHFIFCRRLFCANELYFNVVGHSTGTGTCWTVEEESNIAKKIVQLHPN